jgi:hypothetical protein
MKSGEWLGNLEGLVVREPGPDSDGPVLEIHGEDDSLAATTITDDKQVEKLTEACAELNLLLEDSNSE